MKQKVIDALKRMLKEKEKQNKYPVHILYTELEKDLETISPLTLKNTLRELWEGKVIKAGRTINNTYIRLQ